MKVSVSFTKSKFNSKETIKKINEVSADYLHIDLMDGKFVPQKQQLPSDLSKVLSDVKKPLDVHLMAANPAKYFDFFAGYNTEYITFHLEAVDNPDKVINEIHSFGLKCGISIKPETNVEKLLSYLDKIQQVLIMSVEPGKGGQPFMEEVIPKISFLKKIKTEKNYNYIINVDGGINEETIMLVKDAGVDMVVSGSFICMSDDYEKQIAILKK